MTKAKDLLRYVKENDVDKVAMVLDQGCAVDVPITEYKETSLHVAAWMGYEAIVSLLLDRGCDIDVRDEFGRTALHTAARWRDEKVMKLLLDRGSSIDARDWHQATPLHRAAQGNRVLSIELLLDRGCPVDVLGEGDRTPLHDAVLQGHPEATRLLLKRGADLHARNTHGDTVLHVACDNGNLEIVRLLLDQECQDVTAGHSMLCMDADGNTPLAWAAIKGNAEVANLLLKHVTNSAKSEPIPWDHDVVIAVSTGWDGQITRGEPLTIVPEEVLDGGVQDVQSFFKFLQHPGASYRKKLCIIGPSCWGKTSLIKTLTTEKATRERVDTRTIGIDRFLWSFETPATESSPGRLYEVSVLDFAGQEEYQSAHTIFYSKRTLYVVCVNVKVYSERLKSHKIVASGQADDAMDAFFDEVIYSRIRAVCAREPESEFAFVGTKLDLVRHSEECVERVGDDVLARFRRRDGDEIRALDRSLAELKSRDPHDSAASDATQIKVSQLETLLRQRPKLLISKFVAMSSANTKGLADVREELQHCIVSGDSAFLMPVDYTNVERYLRKIVREAKQTESLTAQIKDIFVRPGALVKTIMTDPQFASLDANDVASILHVLHALGDILWFDKSGGQLSDVIFLSPDLVIDFVRKVINHELGERRPGCFTWLGSPRGLSAIEKAVKNEGRVAHKLLTSLALWRDVNDNNLMLQLKELLFHFQLAYPAGTKRLQFDSDLIVPVYWKKNGIAQSIPSPSPALMTGAIWDYDFQNGLPASLFDRLGVTSYSAIYSNERFFSRASFGTHTDVYWAKIAKHSEDDDDKIGASTLRIQIAASTSPTVWQQLAWYVISVERVLDEYPGLWVDRYAVSKGGQRYEVDQLLEERQERVAVDTMAGVVGDSSTCQLLPQSMDWFTKREWRNVAKKKRSSTVSLAETQASSSEPSLNGFEQLVVETVKQELQRGFQGVHTHLDEVQDTAITLSAVEGNRRDYPALWTLSYREEAAMAIYELQIRSELSGKCYHDPPIRITVPNGFFSKYDVVIKTGLSVLCAVIPDMLGKGVIEYLTSAAGDQIDRSVAVHSLVEGLDLKKDQSLAMEKNRTLSPDATVALLRDLLKQADDSFDPLKMSTISGLECGIYLKAVGQRKKGEHIWAHRREIEDRSDTIRFRHDYHVGAVAVDRVVPKVIVPTPPATTRVNNESEALDGQSTNNASPVKEAARSEDFERVRQDEAALLPNLDPAKMPMPVSTDSSSVEIIVEIVKATNLPDVRLIGTQSPFCQWRILDPHGDPVGSGQTQAHVRGGSNPVWSGQLVRVATGGKTLKDCVFVAAVKTETAIGAMTEVIGEGTYRISDGETSTGKPCELNLVLTSKGAPVGTLSVRLQG